MSAEIIRLLYVSKSRIGTGEASYPARRAILARARAYNLRSGVTGALAYAADVICQVLEGSPDAIGETFARISRDPRHGDITVLSRATATTRLFADWSMAISHAGEAEEAEAAIVFQRGVSDKTEASAREVIEFLLRGVSAAQIW